MLEDDGVRGYGVGKTSLILVRKAPKQYEEGEIPAIKKL